MLNHYQFSNLLEKHYRWFLPLLFLILIAPFTPYLDLKISSYFYQPEINSKGHFTSNGLTDLFYKYGFYPADLLAGFAGMILLGCLFSKKLRKWKAPALVLFLALVIGAGLIVHFVLKDHWGRPRPKQVIEFGGKEEFLPFYKPNFQRTSAAKSFPCGHCSTGFYFFALIVVGKRLQKRSIYRLGIFLTIFLGIGLSITRIAQGGHFFSDTLATALIMWWIALTLDWLIYNKFKERI